MFVRLVSRRLATVFILCAIGGGTSAGAQVSMVPPDHPVYDWLARHRAAGLIPGFSHEMLPLSRGTINGLLLQIQKESGAISGIDRSLLAGFSREFSVDSLRAAQGDTYLQGWDSTIASSVRRKIALMLSHREPYMYAYADSNSSVGVDLRWAVAGFKWTQGDASGSEKYGYATGRAYGSLYNSFGFHLEGTNAYASGDGESVRSHPRWGATTATSKTSALFAEGIATATYKAFGLDFGGGAPRIGLGGRQAVILRTETAQYDWLRLRYDTKLFQYSAMHAALQGVTIDSLLTDPPGVRTRVSPQRWFALHRLQVRPLGPLQLAFTELVTYSNRGPELGYLNPAFPFLLSQFASNDKDNLMMFFDGVLRPVRRVELYGTLGVDDLGELRDVVTGTGKRSYDNRTTKLVYQAGGRLALPRATDVQAEYLRIEPYFYSHKLALNAFHQNGYLLANDIGPNADQLWLSVRQWLPRQSWVRGTFSRTRQGMNFVDATGKVVRDVGGSFASIQSDTAGQVLFLSGDLHLYNTVTLEAHIEPWRGLGFDLQYSNRRVTQGTQIPDRQTLRAEARFAFYPLSFLLSAVGLGP